MPINKHQGCWTLVENGSAMSCVSLNDAATSPLLVLTEGQVLLKVAYTHKTIIAMSLSWSMRDHYPHFTDES